MAKEGYCNRSRRKLMPVIKLTAKRKYGHLLPNLPTILAWVMNLRRTNYPVIKLGPGDRQAAKLLTNSGHNHDICHNHHNYWLFQYIHYSVMFELHKMCSLTKNV